MAGVMAAGGALLLACALGTASGGGEPACEAGDGALEPHPLCRALHVLPAEADGASVVRIRADAPFEPASMQPLGLLINASAIFSVPLAREGRIAAGSLIPVDTRRILGAGLHEVRLVVEGRPCEAAREVAVRCAPADCGPTLVLAVRVRAGGAQRMLMIREGADVLAELDAFAAAHALSARAHARTLAFAQERLAMGAHLGSVRNVLSARGAAGEERRVVIGLGTVRSGTTSLARLLELEAQRQAQQQPGGAGRAGGAKRGAAAAGAHPEGARPEGAQAEELVTHEWRQCDGVPWPSGGADDARVPPRAFRRLHALLQRPGAIVGDVAAWHLPYARAYLRLCPAVRVLALRRARAPTIESIVRFFRWQRHLPFATDDARAHARPIAVPSEYDVCYPKYHMPARAADRGEGARAAALDTAVELEAAAARFYDEYYAEVQALQRDFPDRVAIFESPAVLNDAAAAREMLRYAGIADPVADVPVSVHTGSPHIVTLALDDEAEDDDEDGNAG